MTRRPLHISILAYVLFFAAFTGLVFGIFGIAWVWANEPIIRRNVGQGLDLADRTLGTSANGLELVHLSLLRTASTVLLIKGTSEDLAQSLNETIPLLDRMGRLVGEDMVKILEQTHASLNSAQSSAQLIDDTLRIITAIPIIGRRYNPSTPLAESLDSVADSLDNLPDSLMEIQNGILATGDRMESIKTAVETMSEDIRQAEQTLIQAQDVVEDYQNQVTELQSSMERFRVLVPKIFKSLKWALTIFFFWMVIAQIGLYLQGKNLLQSSSKESDQREPPPRVG